MIEINDMIFNCLDPNDEPTVKEAVLTRADKKDWYVLRYDLAITDYLNQIVFKTLAEAYEEFCYTIADNQTERVELIFSPEGDDGELFDNIVVKHKREPRLIILYDDQEDFYAYTDAPKELIQAAIDYKCDCLNNDILITSDFDCMQEFLLKKGYTLYQATVTDIERYYW